MSTGRHLAGILVVDDEPSVRDILKKRLEDSGFQVSTAADGVEAVDFCSHHGDEVAVVLLDIKMPRLDGPETLERLKTLKRNLPVCFMTGHAGAYDPDELLARGARHLFTKPFKLEEVVRVVSNLAGHGSSDGDDECGATPAS
jgi:CheY-like chemotaxis protein